MPITSSGSFVTAQNKTAGTSFNFTTTSPVQAGNTAILFIATDPTGSATGSNVVSGVTGGGNTWVKLREFTQGTGAGAGATIAMFWVASSNAMATGTAISASLTSAITAKAAGGWAFIGSNITDSANAVTGSASSTNPNIMTLSGLTNREYLFVRGIAHEGPNADTLTLTSGFSAFTGIGTTGGAGGTNMTFRGEWRIVTTSSLTSAPAWSAAGVNASIYFAFFENISGKTYFILVE